ncbi:PH domain-containing protein [Peribacillus sp. JNUCC 23]
MNTDKLSKKALKLIDMAKQYLDSDEVPEYAILGTYETEWMGQRTTRGNGLFLATNKKLFFYAKRMTGYESETFPYSKINSFESGKKLLGHYITFFASSNIVSMKYIQDGNLGDFITYVKSKIEDQQEEVKTNIGISIADELKKLSDLRDAGILSQEEFINQKEKLLS